ncbi:hypothetical protein, partial [Rhodopirellula islandica]|uniref:hypothetical protein n=1 Tax=Rhodopirellula islandica TaxID=595434 RepID=UPI001F3F298A
RGEAPRQTIPRCAPRHRLHGPDFEIYNLQFHFFNPSSVAARHLSPLRGLPSQVMMPKTSG